MKRRYVIGSDMSAVGTSIKDSRNHTAEKIIKDSRNAYRLDKRMIKGCITSHGEVDSTKSI